MFTIYSPDFVPLGMVEDYSSMQWLRQYANTGQFELHTPPSDLLVAENVIRNGNEAAVIESVAITETEEGVMAEVKGRLLTSYLNRRIIWGLAAMTDTAENVMRRLIADNIRGLPLTVAASSGIPGTIDYQKSYGNVLEEVVAIAEAAGLGFKVDFDRVFRVYKGLDRTASQSVNPRAIFSRQFENVLTSEYYYDKSAHRNVALIGGQGEGTDRLLVTIGTATGLERREMFVDARDIGGGTEAEPINVAAQEAMLAQRGEEKIAEFRTTETFTATVNPYGNLKYKADYDLGDIITVIDMGIRLDVRITEIKEIYEDGGLQLELTLGYERMVKMGGGSSGSSGGSGSSVSFDMIYPVGSIYMSVNDVNPSALFGGTWETWGAGKVAVGVDTNQAEFNTVEKSGGAKTHTLTAAQMPSHNHGVLVSGQGGATAYGAQVQFTGANSKFNASYSEATGGGAAHNNLQPYITCYMWKRTA